MSMDVEIEDDVKMMASFAGLTDAEAFAQLFNDTVEALRAIHRMRGQTTDEDLLEKTQWRLEAALGYAPSVITDDD